MLAHAAQEKEFQNLAITAVAYDVRTFLTPAQKDVLCSAYNTCTLAHTCTRTCVRVRARIIHALSHTQHTHTSVCVRVWERVLYMHARTHMHTHMCASVRARIIHALSHTHARAHVCECESAYYTCTLAHTRTHTHYRSHTHELMFKWIQRILLTFTHAHASSFFFLVFEIYLISFFSFFLHKAANRPKRKANLQFDSWRPL